ncbi:MAG: DUF4440 domain-containing protein [Pseudomonadota bacterium]
MSIQKLIAYGAIVSIASMSASGTVLGQTSDDVQGIIRVLESYEQFVNAGDAQSVGGLYASDAILLPDRFDAFEGAENITGFYAFAFDALSLELEFDIDPSDIIVSGDVAYATTTSVGTRFIKEGNQTVPEINRELWVFEEIDGEWKIARYCFNQSQ